MTAPEGFGAADLVRLREIEEVEIETSAGDGAPQHRTVIWAVVDRQDRVLVRSYRGATARWYREARANPRGRLHVAGRALEVAIAVADDPERVAACSDGLLRKYAGDPATPQMVADEVLDTTLELIPA